MKERFLRLECFIFFCIVILITLKIYLYEITSRFHVNSLRYKAIQSVKRWNSRISDCESQFRNNILQYRAPLCSIFLPPQNSDTCTRRFDFIYGTVTSKLLSFFFSRGDPLFGDERVALSVARGQVTVPFRFATVIHRKALSSVALQFNVKRTGGKKEKEREQRKGEKKNGKRQRPPSWAREHR